MRNRHNKKRNTAFIYESLIREVTACVIKKDAKQKEKIMSVVKKHFHVDSVLYYDLKNYRSLYENQNINEEMSKQILAEAKYNNRLIDPDKLFNAQTDLINDVNKEISPTVFNTFVPNYKTLATIHQIFSPTTEPRSRVILEQQVIENMSNSIVESDIQEVDALTLNKFVEKFNEKYDNTFSDEQKTLLNNYITSFVDNGLQLKIYLNEELLRLNSKLEESKSTEYISEDSEMVDKVIKIQDSLESFKTAKVDDESLFKILKTQELVKEIFDNVGQD